MKHHRGEIKLNFGILSSIYNRESTEEPPIVTRIMKDVGINHNNLKPRLLYFEEHNMISRDETGVYKIESEGFHMLSLYASVLLSEYISGISAEKSGAENKKEVLTI
jgi:predicted transcriptional regulator